MNIIEVDGKWQVVEGERVLLVAESHPQAVAFVVERRPGAARVQRRKARERMIQDMLDRQKRLLKLRSRQTPYEDRLLEPRARTHKSRLFGNRWPPQTMCALCRKLRRSSDAVATSRQIHQTPRSGQEGQHRRWGRALQEIPESRHLGTL
jgi:hypothetical protein